MRNPDLKDKKRQRSEKIRNIERKKRKLSDEVQLCMATDGDGNYFSIPETHFCHLCYNVFEAVYRSESDIYGISRSDCGTLVGVSDPTKGADGDGGDNHSQNPRYWKRIALHSAYKAVLNFSRTSKEAYYSLAMNDEYWSMISRHAASVLDGNRGRGDLRYNARFHIGFESSLRLRSRSTFVGLVYADAGRTIKKETLDELAHINKDPNVIDMCTTPCVPTTSQSDDPYIVVTVLPRTHSSSSSSSLTSDLDNDGGGGVGDGDKENHPLFFIRKTMEGDKAENMSYVKSSTLYKMEAALAFFSRTLEIGRLLTSGMSPFYVGGVNVIEMAPVRPVASVQDFSKIRRTSVVI